MTNKEAQESYERETYELAKTVDKLVQIKNRMDFINEQMDWDGTFSIQFSEAIEKLSEVQSAAIIYTMEEKYRNSDLENYRDMVKALEKEHGK